MTRYVDRALSVIAQTLWNMLPTHIQADPSLDTSKTCQSGQSA